METLIAILIIVGVLCLIAIALNTFATFGVLSELKRIFRDSENKS